MPRINTKLNKIMAIKLFFKITTPLSFISYNEGMIKNIVFNSHYSRRRPEVTIGLRKLGIGYFPWGEGIISSMTHGIIRIELKNYGGRKWKR